MTNVEALRQAIANFEKSSRELVMAVKPFEDATDKIRGINKLNNPRRLDQYPVTFIKQMAEGLLSIVDLSNKPFPTKG